MSNWKPVVNFEGIYEVSDTGGVRCLLNNRGNTLAIPKPRSICYDKKGYAFVTLSKDKKKSTHFVHRLVAMSFLPNEDNLPEVNHKDEDPTNNNVGNLEWCTSQYNMEYSHAINLTLIDPSGSGVTITNLRKFCRDNNLDCGCMSRVISGKSSHHKGWKLNA